MTPEPTIAESIRATADRLEADASPAKRREVLQRRAHALATRVVQGDTAQALHEVVVVRRRESLVGLPMASAREIRPVSAISLPHATPFVQGVFQLRGEVLCLLDLQPFLGEPEALPTDGTTMAVLVAHAGKPIGVRIDEVIGPRSIYPDDCNESLARGAREFVATITHDLISVIDIGALLRRPEMTLDVP